MYYETPHSSDLKRPRVLRIFYLYVHKHSDDQKSSASFCTNIFSLYTHKYPDNRKSKVLSHNRNIIKNPALCYSAIYTGSYYYTYQDKPVQICTLNPAKKSCHMTFNKFYTYVYHQHVNSFCGIIHKNSKNF